MTAKKQKPKHVARLLGGPQHGKHVFLDEVLPELDIGDGHYFLTQWVTTASAHEVRESIEYAYRGKVPDKS